MDNSKWNNTGAVWPMILPTGQSWYDIGGILASIQYLNIKTFVEIGVCNGGIAALLWGRQKIDTTFRYYGIEINKDVIDARLPANEDRFNVLVGDIFENIEWLKNAINHSGATMVFCDGGNKPEEARLVASLLRSGDFVLIHDYTIEFFDEDVPKEYTRLHLWLTYNTHLWLGTKS